MSAPEKKPARVRVPIPAPAEDPRVRPLTIGVRAGRWRVETETGYALYLAGSEAEARAWRAGYRAAEADWIDAEDA